LQLITAAPAHQSPQPCSERETAAMRDAVAAIRRGDDVVLAEGWSRVADISPLCPAIRLAWLAARGWSQARALAAVAGDPAELGPVQATLQDIEAVADPGVALEREYAVSAIRAAIAAAQDERGELSLLLDHARDLAERLTARGRPATWPRPFNLLSGELWFEVDRYAESFAAYDRVIRGDRSPAGYVGAARALARLGRLPEACAALRAASDAAPALRDTARGELDRCR
jgi:hypothetical protein